MCAIKAWAISNACINFRAQHPLANKTFLFVDQISPDFFPGTREDGGIAVDHVSFTFRISGVVPEIFAIKVESCQKSS